MLSIVYTSVASVPFSDADLAELLRHSRAANERSGLTGVLLYQGGQFLQVLEGDEDVVRARYAVIAADARHGEVETVGEETITARRFPEWSMGHHAITEDTAAALPGHDDVFVAERAGRRSITGDRVQEIVTGLAGG